MDLSESNSIPANGSVVEGPNVLSEAMGMPRNSQREINNSKWALQTEYEDEIVRNSSSK
jgi:uncharacterized protein (UPF0147 family)